jgi:hydrogenase expression/formation protein HypC
MCLGIPMRVVRSDGYLALCEGRGERRHVNMMLVGEQPVGTWVLVHLDSAREVVDEVYAARINEGLDAIEAVMRGESIAGMFSDLSEREPELPPSLRPQQER